MGAGSDKTAKAVPTEFGIGTRDSYGALTYRAIDLAVTLCLGTVMLVLPIVLSWPTLRSSAKRLTAATK